MRETTRQWWRKAGLVLAGFLGAEVASWNLGLLLMLTIQRTFPRWEEVWVAMYATEKLALFACSNLLMVLAGLLVYRQWRYAGIGVMCRAGVDFILLGVAWIAYLVQE